MFIKVDVIYSNDGHSSRKDNREIIKKTLRTFENFVFQDHWINYNQMQHKASLGEGHSSMFSKKGEAGE